MFKKISETKSKMNNNHHENSRGRLKFLAVVFCTVFLFGSIFSLITFKPKPAEAFLGIGDVSVTIGDIPRIIADRIDDISTVVWDGLLELAKTTAYNTIDKYVQNLAYETALGLATGSAGQKPLIWGKPLLQSLEDAGSAAMGDYLDKLSTDVLGHSLCEPIDPKFNLQLSIMLEKAQKPPEAKCNLTDIWHKGVLGSWNNAFGENGSGLGFANMTLEDTISFSNYFDPSSNNLGTLIAADRELRQEMKKKGEIELKTREIEGNFKSLRTTIDEKVITPSETLKDTISDINKAATTKQIPAKEIPETSSVLTNILMRGLQTFGSTFLGSWTKTLFKKGLVEPLKKAPSDAIFYASKGGLAQARSYYNKLVRPQFETDISVDVTSNLGNCPRDPDAQRWYNCRISSDLKQAIDNQVTLKEAVTPVSQGGLGLIDPGALYGFDRNGRQEPDWENGFPYSSLVIMRKYRIVPVTWELAALYIKEVMHTTDHGGKTKWTIKDVMDCYEQPDDPTTTALDESQHNSLPVACRIDPTLDCSVTPLPDGCVNPFWHLVNPDWVLKSPATKCYQEGPGAEIIYEELIEVPRKVEGSLTEFESAQQRIVSRADYCADERSCILEDDEGNCLFYGQCVHEKPIWHFNADSCPAQFNTCRSLTPTEGAYNQFLNTGSEQVSYLTNTMESCSIDAAGCGWYSTYYNEATGEWEGNENISTINNTPDRVYLNSNAEACSIDNAGCTTVYKPTGFSSTVPGINDLVRTQNLIGLASGGTPYNELANIETKNMKLSPDWMNCSPANANKSEQCDNYATECDLLDLGCQYYTPLNGDPQIPAKHIPDNLCIDEGCVGFNAFHEVPSWFTDASDGVIDGQPNATYDFVPSTAQQCNQPGCETFTNLDEVAAGGEGIEYYTKIRQCVTPGAPGVKTYFTWEGSDTTGYQLKRWVMLEGAGGAPCTGVEPGAPTTCIDTTSCDPLTAGPNCRSFFDSNGNIYNADIDLVIYSHDDCHPLRRTVDDTVYYGITSLSQTCQAQNVNCLEYKGPGANNIRVLFVDTFEPEDTTPSNLTFGWEDGLVVNESLQLNGHSLYTDNAVYKEIGYQPATSTWFNLSFYAKPDVLGNNIEISWCDISNCVILGTVNLTTDEWQRYEFLASSASFAPNGIEATDTINLGSAGAYIDNIILKEAPGTHLFIQDSWDSDLAAQCSAHNDYGCQLYRAQGGERLALKAFDRICLEKFVGCSAFIDTQNTVVEEGGYNPVDARVYNTANDLDSSSNIIFENLLDNVLVPDDEAILLVDNPDKYCPVQARGCEVVGIPEFYRQATTTTDFPSCNGTGCPLAINVEQPAVVGFEEVTIINNPDSYNTTLCQSQELFCTQYNTTNNSAVTYVDPGDRTCEYLENVSVGGALITGWFKQGTSEPCTIVGSTQPNYQEWVGECEAEFDSCSMIRDVEASPPQDYYLLHNTLEDSISECSEQGIVDRAGGCRLFADYSEFGIKPDLRSASAYNPFISPDGSAPQSDPNELPPAGSGNYPANTTNILAKVTPDRICDEFLHCVSSLVVTEDQSKMTQTGQGKEKAVCLGIGLCSQIDSTGKCVDGTAQVLGYNDSPSQKEIFNNYTPLSQADREDIGTAEWQLGLSRYGATWPQTVKTGLFGYHEMSETGSPLTIPNSGFEDVNNFGHRYSTWPDEIYRPSATSGLVVLQNARIVSRQGGISPYEGEKMLTMTPLGEAKINKDAFITTAPLPISEDLIMNLSFYVNKDALIAPAARRCTQGHINMIGQECSDGDPGDVECQGLSEPLLCEPDGIQRYCKDGHNSCQSYLDCSGGLGLCGTFSCRDAGSNNGLNCDPNNPTAVCGSSPAICGFDGPSEPGNVCTKGAINKIGQRCITPQDCQADHGLCEDVGSSLILRILEGNGDFDGRVINNLEYEINLPAEESGWIQVNQLFMISSTVATNLNIDNFRVQIYLQAGETRGTLQLDNVEVVAGLWISNSQVVGPSCRLYAKSEALSCDFTDKSNITGGDLLTHKGWRGYCVESVPDQQSVCLNWWPVDIIQGDVNLFSGGDVVDMNYANNLYYCLHSSGDKILNYGSDYVYHLTGNRIKLNGGEDDCEGWEPPNGVIMGCARNASGNQGCGDSTKNWQSTKCQLGGSWYPPFTSLPETWFHKDMIQSIKFKKAPGARGEYPNTVILDRDLIRTENPPYETLSSGMSMWYVNCNRQSPPSGDNGFYCSRSDDYLIMAVVWGPEGYLAGYYVYMDDYSGDNSNPTSWNAYFYFRDMCYTIARVNTAYGAHTPWLSRFENPDNENSLLYQNPEQDKEPLGAIAPPSNAYLPYVENEDNPWLNEPMFAMSDSESLYCGGQLLPQSCARAGSPYSCQFDCGETKICINGAFSKLGTTCQTNNDCIDPDLPNAKGVCGGFIGDMAASTPWSFDLGINNLKKLFAKSYDIYGWDFDKSQYVLCDTNAPFSEMPFTCAVPENLMGVAGSSKFYPNINSSSSVVVLDNYDITGCGWPGFINNNTFMCGWDGSQVTFNVQDYGSAPEVTSLKIENKTSGSVNVVSGQFVTMEFYPNVDPNRQPLKGLRIDWGDGSPHQPNQDLSNLAGQGLPITNYTFVHQYICTDTVPCTAIPRIQLKDNWGWCTDEVYKCDRTNGWTISPVTITIEPSAAGGGGGNQTFIPLGNIPPDLPDEPVPYQSDEESGLPSSDEELVSYTITANVISSGGGSIAPSGAVAVLEGDNQTFTITPPAGGSITQLLVDGAAVAIASTYTFTNVTSDHTITATVEPPAVPVFYNISASKKGSGILFPTGDFTVAEGSDQRFTATPAPGYSVTNFSVDGVSIPILGGVGLPATYTLKNIQADHTIAVTFTSSIILTGP